MIEPRARISRCRIPTALVEASSDRKEFEQTSSARWEVWGPAVVRIGRISCRITGTPEFAACHAASEPASPPPMMWIGRMDALVTKLYAIVNAFGGKISAPEPLGADAPPERRVSALSEFNDQAEAWLATERRTMNSISPRRMPMSSSSRSESCDNSRTASRYRRQAVSFSEIVLRGVILYSFVGRRSAYRDAT